MVTHLPFPLPLPTTQRRGEVVLEPCLGEGRGRPQRSKPPRTTTCGVRAPPPAHRPPEWTTIPTAQSNTSTPPTTTAPGQALGAHGNGSLPPHDHGNELARLPTSRSYRNSTKTLARQVLWHIYQGNTRTSNTGETQRTRDTTHHRKPRKPTSDSLVRKRQL